MAPAMRTIVCSVALVAVIAAILSVSHTPAPAPSPKAQTQQSDPDAAALNLDPAIEPADSDYIKKAHRHALEEVIAQIEALAPTVAPWELLRSGQSPRHPGLTLSSHLRANQEKRPWQRLARELYSVDATRLDHEGKVLYPTAAFWIERSLHTPEFSDPLAALARVEQITQSLAGEVARGQDVDAWRPAVEAAANALTSVPLASQLHPQEQRAVRAACKRLDTRLDRWLSSQRLQWIRPAWQRTLMLLRSKLADYKSRALARPLDKTRSLIDRKDFEHALHWEIGRKGTVPETLHAIAYSQKKLKALSKTFPAPANNSSSSAPSIAQCIARQDTLRALLGEQQDWIEAPLNCERLLELSRFATLDDLSIALIDEGWIEATRSKVRRAQRRLIAALASQWRPQVHRQIRRIMFLYPLLQASEDAEQQAWLRRVYHRTLNALQDQLCRGQQLLAPLLSAQERRELAPEGQRCSKRERALHQSPMIQALISAHSGTLPATRAIMAGLDRFYWGPTRVALYWSTPAGVEPETYGRRPRAAVTKPETQLTPLRRHADPRPAPAPSRNP